MLDRKITLLKVRLIRALKQYQVENSLTQAEMSVLLETSQPRVSYLIHEQAAKFSLDVLFKWAYTLDIETQITI